MEIRYIHVPSFDSPITSIDAECFNNKYIIVGLENGDVYILKGDDAFGTGIN